VRGLTNLVGHLSHPYRKGAAATDGSGGHFYKHGETDGYPTSLESSGDLKPGYSKSNDTYTSQMPQPRQSTVAPSVQSEGDQSLLYDIGQRSKDDTDQLGESAQVSCTQCGETKGVSRVPETTTYACPEHIVLYHVKGEEEE
jgi:hypothetical protein